MMDCIGFFHACKPAVCGELDLSLGSPPGLGFSVLSSLTLMFVLLELSPPFPALSPSLAARTQHSRKQPLLNSALIQASTSRVCSVLDIPPSRLILFFAALLLSARHPVLSQHWSTAFCSVAEEGEKCFCESNKTKSCTLALPCNFECARLDLLISI